MKRTRTYGRYAVVVGLAMALGPLTALSVSSLTSDVAITADRTDALQPLQTHDLARDVSPEVADKSLADVAAGAGSLDLFSALMRTGGLDPLLTDSRQFTLFLPVNGAFAGLDAGHVQAMLQDPELAKQVVQAHIVPGRVTKTDLMIGSRLQSVAGDSVTPRTGASVTVNGATVLHSETAGNGIVHFVDRLLTARG